MLVLKRKTGESLLINDMTEVRVLKICGGRVRLGITAPADITIRRSELAADPAAENDRTIELSAERLKAK